MNDLEKRLANFRIEEGYRKERERRVRADDAATIARLTAERDRLREALGELADLMDAICDGEYKPDSFTTQPARAALEETEAE